VERSRILRYLWLLIQYKIQKALMELAWARDDTWSALCYEERMKEIKEEMDECDN
jgi:hypothetical protein